MKLKIFIAGQKLFGEAALKLALKRGHEIVGVSAPPPKFDKLDRLAFAAREARLPVMKAGTLNADTLPPGVDLIIAAHSHDFIGRKTRLASKLGAIGYHPSLLPRHRGRDAVKWAIKMGDPIAGGSVYWLNDRVDGGHLAAQAWCWIRPNDTAEELWRRDLFPMGLRLLDKALGDIEAGKLVRVAQDEKLATWEPAMAQPPLARPDLIMLGPGPIPGFTVEAENLG